jgi:hypothetical protein
MQDASIFAGAPPRLTPEEKEQWERDGMIWRRGVFSAEDMAAWKAPLDYAYQNAPLGMRSGPGTRVFFSDDPTTPECLDQIVEDPMLVHAMHDMIGGDVDYLYTKIFFKDREVKRDMHWHWDHTVSAAISCH